MRSVMSPAAAALLRSLLARSGVAREHFLVGAVRSVDWQSLTFTGERHELGLRLTGPDAVQGAARLRDGLAEADWPLRGHVVADIAIVAERRDAEGAQCLDLEALTLAD